MVRASKHGWLAVGCALAVLSIGQRVLGQTAAPAIPLTPGLTIVLAAHNAEPAAGSRGGARPSGMSRRETTSLSWP